MDDSVIWLIAGVVGIVVEMLTLTFVILYFGIGALAAAAAAALGASGSVQVVTFATVSMVLLALTRKPMLSLVQARNPHRTNVHALIGKTGIVTIPLDEAGARGQIRVGTEYWTARAVIEGEAFAEGDRVEVVAVEGVTAHVRARETSLEALQ